MTSNLCRVRTRNLLLASRTLYHWATVTWHRSRPTLWYLAWHTLTRRKDIGNLHFIWLQVMVRTQTVFVYKTNSWLDFGMPKVPISPGVTGQLSREVHTVAGKGNSLRFSAQKWESDGHCVKFSTFKMNLRATLRNVDKKTSIFCTQTANNYFFAIF